jgi:hypothetical protein
MFLTVPFSIAVNDRSQWLRCKWSTILKIILSEFFEKRSFAPKAAIFEEKSQKLDKDPKTQTLACFESCFTSVHPKIEFGNIEFAFDNPIRI